MEAHPALKVDQLSNLVIQTAFLGDLILSVPVLRRIKKKFPDQKLLIVCKKGIGQFLLNEKIVDQIFEIEKSNSESYAEVLNQLNKLKINNLFCLHRSFRSQIFSGKIKALKKIGFESFVGAFIFDHMVEYVAEYPEVIRQFKILETVDAESAQILNSQDYSYLNDNSLPQIPIFFTFDVNTQPEFNSEEKTVAIFPGSVWQTKKWTEQGFIELIDTLLKNGLKIELLGGVEERSICERIAENFSTGVKVRAGDISLENTINSISKYSLVICNDSAPTHMAALKGVPNISIFGPTTLDLGFRPWSNVGWVVQNTEIKCRPCGKHGHDRCPLQHHNCMKSISAKQVFEKVRIALKLK